MSDDLISRQAAIDAYLETVEPIAVQEWDGEISACARDRDILEMLENLPSVQSKTGHWIERVDERGDVYYECSNCEEPFTFIGGTPADNLYIHCPYCGAKMKGETE